MNFVFFDIECANCLNGEGKICSFGFVKTDEHFQVLKKKDILIDPDAPFLLGNAKRGDGIRLAYPLFRFRNSFTFPHYYKEIKTLLEDKNNICFGFSVRQDVAYLISTCRRYSLPMINFSFFDIQQFEKELYQRKNCSGLDSLVEQFHVQKYTYHRSDDDALMSEEVFASILKEKEIPLSELSSHYEECFFDTERMVNLLNERKIAKEKKRIYQEKVEKLFINEKVDYTGYDKHFYKRHFFFSNKVISENIDKLLEMKKQLSKTGIIFERNPKEADAIVVLSKIDYDGINPSRVERMEERSLLFATFLKHAKKSKKA